MNSFFLECCANSITSAIQGEIGGANRIELCSNLEVGGVTPTKEDIVSLSKIITIPFRILIRPRAGSFVYTKSEIQQMITDLKFCKSLNCEGIVIGMLKKNNRINISETKKLVELAQPMKVTFHRAFDEANNLITDLEDVIKCGCDSLLTSGQSSNVDIGLSNLKKIIKIANNRIKVIAGGGVNHDNAKNLYNIGVRNFHLSGKKKNTNGFLETSSLLIKSVIDNLNEPN
tara:strand:- start:3627 stop:4316 length:690 start_codon:yes stop_codon:yes gene_type:complete